MKVVSVGDLDAVVAEVRGQKVPSTTLFDDDAPDGLNFRINRTDFLANEGGFTTPRHHHVFQQIRWAEFGALNYAPGKNLEVGDVAYFPRSTWYGPQMKDSGISIALQFGYNNECQYGGDRKRDRAEATERLKSKGVSEEGIFTDIDPTTGEKRRRDSVQAIDEEQFEATTGQKFEFPAEGYDEPIVMHPSAFDYFEVAPGVEVKRLGSFFDHAGPNADVRISMIRLSNHGRYELEVGRAQIAWTKDSGLIVDGDSYPELTFVYCPRNDTGSLSGVDGVEVNLVELPLLA